MVSHRSAAQLLQLGDLEADRHEFTVPERRQSRRDDIRFHLGRLTRDEWTVVDGLPVTTVMRTIEDLAAGRLDGGHLAGVVRDAIVRHHVDVGELSATLRPHTHRYGAPLGSGEALLRRFLDEAGVPESTRRIAEISGHQRTT